MKLLLAALSSLRTCPDQQERLPSLEPKYPLATFPFLTFKSMNHSVDLTLWPVGTPVRVVKLAACSDARRQACSLKDWKVGQLNGGSVPVDYELMGLLIRPLKIGESILVARIMRNDISAGGIFLSTPVREFKNGAAITLNSIYFISRFDLSLSS